MAVVSHKKNNLALATCLVSDDIGMMVSVSGPAVDGKYSVESADPSDFSKMPAVAIIVDKIDTTTCIIQFSGIVKSVYSGLPSGKLLFVDDDGMLSDEPPAPTLLKPFMFSQSAGVTISGDEINLDPSSLMVRQRY